MTPGDKKSPEQGERFAVACLAFVLHHDEAFRAHFLRNVCGWDKPNSAKEFEVAIELTGCGDLAIQSLAYGTIFVLECKIGAPIESHQNPNSGDFFHNGYGAGTLAYKPWHAAKAIRRSYITLTQETPTTKYQQHPALSCAAKTWVEVCGELSPATTSGLVDDLFKTLAAQRIHCFASWNMKTRNLNLASHYFEACQIHALIENAASLVESQFGLLAKRTDEIELNSPEESYIGRILVCKNAPTHWRTLTGQINAGDKDALAWLGYAWRCVQVGFFPKDKAAQTALDALETIKRSGEQVGGENDYVWINTPNNGALGDQEWILSVFQRLEMFLKSNA
jgi:hypothetical protein